LGQPIFFVLDRLSMRGGFSRRLILDVQVFVNFPNSGVGKKILILEIPHVFPRSKFFSALDLNKFPKNLKIE
jgi:hypothetical protein